MGLVFGALLRRLIFSLLILSAPALAQQLPPSGQWKETAFMAFENYVEVFDGSLDAVCRKAYTFGPATIYYKGINFEYAVRTMGGGIVYASCNAKYGGATQSTPAYKVCATYEIVNGSKTLKSFSYSAEKCEKPCDRCAKTVGNPVDVANFTKITKGTDWSSLIEPRFKIERVYRSDAAFSARFEGSFPSTLDLFSGTWQRTYSDLIYWAKNPYDPADTRTWERHETGDGQAMYFLLDDPTQSIGAPGYTLTRDAGGSTRYLTGPDGVVKTFYKPFSTPFALTSIEWPDGYKITFEREIYIHHLGMTDNKGNKAVFVFNQNVVPGADRRLISEIIIQRLFGSSYVETGRLLYGYAALGYPALGANGNTASSVTPVVESRQPVITSVDYLAAGSSTPTPVWRYTYATALPSLPPNPDGSLLRVQDNIVDTPLLTSISDGGVEPFAEYSYKYYGFDPSGRYLGFGVATEKLAGDAQPTEFGRNAVGTVHIMTNPKGLATNFGFAEQERNKKVVSISTPATTGTLDTTLTTAHGPDEFVAETVNRNGSKTTYTRDAKGRVLTMTEDATGPAARVTSYTWHATLRLPLTRTTEGLVETFTYDAAGLLLTYSQTDTKPGSPTLNQVRTWTYGYSTLANGLKVLTTLNGPGLTSDGITDVTTYTYTTTGDLATATDPNGLVTTVLGYTTSGQPSLIEQADKNRWSFTYDRNGRVLTSGFAGPGQTPLLSSFAYNLSGQITSYTNSRGKIWTFTYDAARRLTGSTSPMSDKVAYSYDAAGNVIKEEYRNGTNPVTFWEGTEFDGLSRILKTTGAMGQQWAFAHDREDNLTAVTDPTAKTTTNGFDALNRLVTTVDRENYTTGMDYNPADQLTEYTDPRAIETDFTYNGFGEVITEVSADRGTIAYAYDRRGLVTSRTDGRGINTLYVYDNAGRLTLIDYPAATIPDIAFTYDTAYLGVPANSNKGHVGQITDGIIATQFGHEVTATGPRIKATATYPAGRVYTVTEETDFEGNPTRTIYPSGREVLYTVDNANRITSIKLKNGATTTNLLTAMTYVPMGGLKTALYGDGYTQTRTYDKSYRMTGLKDVLGTTKLRDLAYLYEGRDNLTKVTDKNTAGNTETFTYTPRESLTTATGPYGALAYTYDGVGNRLTAKLGTATDSYTYPATSNRLSVINLATGGTRGFTYDAAGSVTAEARTGGTYSYTYNAAGRMETFSINGFLQAQYKYDAMGRQAIRTLTSPTPVTIHSVFDSDGRRIAEYNETSGALIREYVWNGWDPVAVIEGGVVSFVRADHIGRPVFATNSTGVKVWSATYTPFGGVHTSTGALPTARFPGQWFQSESGLHQNWMRDYDPTTGRYLQADPLGLVDGASVYGYVKQSPMRFTDPTGQFIPAVWACLTNPVCAGAVITAGYLIYDLFCAETTEDYINAFINAALSMGNPCKGPLKAICAAPFRGGKGGGAGSGAGSGGPMTPDQQALKDLVDEATNGGRKPLPAADAETVLDWAAETNYPDWRAGAGDVGSPSNWVGGPHIHIPGAGRGGHVPVEPGVTPRP